MNVTYPLSLKVSVWLMLNLLLLAAAVVGFFVVQGGLGWGALLAGPAGDQAQAKANVIASEVAAATAENRAAVLARYATTYKADLFLVRGDEVSFATAHREFPASVRARTEYRPPRKGPGPRAERGSEAGPTGERLPATEPELVPRAPQPAAAEPAAGRGEAFDPARERERSRFIVKDDTGSGYWIGLRVPFMSFERGRFRGPTTVIARVDSLPDLLRYLELQSWLLAGLGMVALSIVFWLPLVRSLTRSIGQLTRATEQIAEGRFDTRVNDRRRDELGKLGESVNRMADRLDAHMSGQKRFLGDVAHELCSPLARLQMATGILAEQAPKQLEPTVADLRDEVQQMSSLVNELLAFTKAGLRPRDVVLSPVPVEPLVRDVVAREDATGRVSVEIAPELHARAERDLLARALGNLVRNAIRYAGTGPITVTAVREGKHVSLRVDDAGPGVPVGDLDRLGEPFFRPELARTRESGGVGLGLAIVRNSIAACGGAVRFSNRAPQGFRAEIRLAVA